MAQTFPPLPPAPPTAIILHVVLLLLAIASVVGLFVKSRRRARLGDVLLWPAVMVAAAVLRAHASHLNLEPAYRLFLLGSMLFVWAVAGTACVISIVRLTRQGEGREAALLLGSLLALGLFLVLLLPAESSRAVSPRTRCKNNIKHIMLAIHNWHDRYGRLPDAQFADDDQPPRSWRVELLPYVDQFPLRRQYDDSKPWDDAANLPIARTAVRTWSCPSNLHPRDAQERYFTAYLLVTGPRTVLPDGRGLTLKAIGDGLANTITVAEAAGLNVVWTRPRDVDILEDPVGVNLPGEQPTHSPAVLSSYHRGGVHVGMADGSVRFLSENADPQVIKALLTANGGEDVDGF